MYLNIKLCRKQFTKNERINTSKEQVTLRKPVIKSLAWVLDDGITIVVIVIVVNVIEVIVIVVTAIVMTVIVVTVIVTLVVLFVIVAVILVTVIFNMILVTKIKVQLHDVKNKKDKYRTRAGI